jgi:uncharacterized protein YlxP (DUF503 family)
MFVAVARVVLQIPESGSLKAKRQVLRRVTDRLKARFNVAVAEVGDNDLWQRAVIGLSVVGNERRHVDEQMQKILHAVEEMYVAPVLERQVEVLGLGERLFSTAEVRSLADAEAERDGWAEEEAEREAEEAALAAADGEDGEEGAEVEGGGAGMGGLDLEGGFDLAAHLARGDRSMAEAEGMGAWEARHGRGRAGAPRGGAPRAGAPRVGGAAAARPGGSGAGGAGGAGGGSGGGEGRPGGSGGDLTLEQARARARALRNPREWEKP